MDIAAKNRQVANSYYNLGLEKAKIRDLSGAAQCLSLIHIYHPLLVMNDFADASLFSFIKNEPVSYTHLDVYKRQVPDPVPDLSTVSPRGKELWGNTY